MDISQMKNIVIKCIGFSNYRKMLTFTMRRLTKTDDKILYSSSVSDVCRYSVENKDVFFGYYDLKSLSCDNSKLLSHVIDGEKAVLGYFDTKTRKFVKICTSDAWNWQMGSRLRWYADGESIIFNDFDGSNFISRIVDINGKELRRFAHPIFDIDIESGNAYFTDFTILHYLREGYGYDNIVIEFEKYYKETPNGLWKFNLNNGTCQMIISIDRLVKLDSVKEMLNGYNYINHITINPYNKDIMFFHLWKSENQLGNRMIFTNSNGEILSIISNFVRASHYAWKDAEHILITLLNNNNEIEYRLYDYKNGNYKLVNGIAADGHPSYINERFFVTDTYPNRCAMQSVYMCDSKSCSYKNIFSIYHPPEKIDASRCDLHPRLHGNIINIDTASEKHRCQYLFKVDGDVRDFSHWGHHLLHNREAVIENDNTGKTSLLSIIKSEYLFITGRKKCNTFKALLLFFQDPTFKVNVYIAKMQNVKKRSKKKKIRKMLESKYGIVVDQNCEIGKHFRADHFTGIVIGPGAIIGEYCKMYQNVTIGQKNGMFPHIGDYVTIYPGAKIIGDVKIEDYAIIGANAVVTGNVPAGSTAVGVPAKNIQGEKMILWGD